MLRYFKGIKTGMCFGLAVTAISAMPALAQTETLNPKQDIYEHQLPSEGAGPEPQAPDQASLSDVAASPGVQPAPQILGPSTDMPQGMQEGADTTQPVGPESEQVVQTMPSGPEPEHALVSKGSMMPSGPDALPPQFSPAEPEMAADGSALPDAGDVDARAPGMTLPVEPGLDVPPGGPLGTDVVEKTKEEIEAEIREAAFTAALTGLLPLEPPEIRRVIERFDKTQEAVEVPIYPYPEPEIVVKSISLDPGTKPLEIKVAAGHVTTVAMVDSTSAPWPIQDITWAGNFEVVQPEAGGHIFRITPLSEFAYGNMSIRLLELKTPVTFMIRTHRDGVHYRVDARLQQLGPMATPPIIAGSSGPTIAAGDSDLAAILDGMPPEDAMRMDVSGVDGRTTAYLLNDMVYVRTPLSLLSPAWDKSVKSADGMNVYTLENSPVLLLSDQGRMVRARISERTFEQ